MIYKDVDDFLVFEYEVTIWELDKGYQFDLKLNDDIGEVIASYCGFDTLLDAKIDALETILKLMKEGK